MTEEVIARQGERPWLRHYEQGVPTTLSYPEVPLFRFLDESSERFPERPACTFFGATLTYRTLRNLADRFAAALVQLGLRPGGKVSLHLPNCPQFLIAYYGTLKAGGVVVPFNPLYTEREIALQLKDSGAEISVVLDMLYPRVAAVLGDTSVRHIIFTGVQDYLPPLLRLLYPLKARREGHWVTVPESPTVHRFKRLLERAPAQPPQVEVKPDDVAVLLYTGGTTGTPKGAMLTHRNLVANTIQSISWFTMVREGQDTTLGVLPFFHSYGMTVVMNFSVRTGGHIVLLPRFSPDDVLKAIQRYRPAYFPGVPTMYIALLNHPRISRYNLRSIKACISGAAALPMEVQRRFEEVTGGKLVEGYGLTEASPVTHCNPIFGLRKAGSIGIPFPDTEAKIVDVETGTRDLPPGEIGELVIRGPQVMKGYHNRPDETAAALRDGWLYTGDIARMDEDGYFYIVDRKKEMIITGGFNVYPREVEEVLYQHPAVKEAAAIGVPDPYKGEVVKAFVVLKEGETATAEELIEFCRQRLAPYKVPRSVEFRTELPKTLVGKILRRVLMEEERKKA
jgi:long-chain acyl-CoA synthetase